MKKCPYCAEEIQDEAVKCKHCGEFLTKQTHVKWYFRTFGIVIIFLCVGPLVLPLVWVNPQYSRNVKIIASAVIIIASVILWVLTASALKTINAYYQQVQDLFPKM